MKVHMTMEANPRIAHVVQIGVLQRRLARTKGPGGRKVIQTKITYLADAITRWVKDGEMSAKEIADGFEAEDVDLGTLDAQLMRMLAGTSRRRANQ